MEFANLPTTLLTGMLSLFGVALIAMVRKLLFLDTKIALLEQRAQDERDERQAAAKCRADGRAEIFTAMRDHNAAVMSRLERTDKDIRALLAKAT